MKFKLVVGKEKYHMLLYAMKYSAVNQISRNMGGYLIQLKIVIKLYFRNLYAFDKCH